MASPLSASASLCPTRRQHPLCIRPWRCRTAPTPRQDRRLGRRRQRQWPHDQPAPVVYFCINGGQVEWKKTGCHDNRKCTISGIIRHFSYSSKNAFRLDIYVVFSVFLVWTSSADFAFPVLHLRPLGHLSWPVNSKTKDNSTAQLGSRKPAWPNKPPMDFRPFAHRHSTFVYFFVAIVICAC
jgi:hypothetical protein